MRKVVLHALITSDATRQSNSFFEVTIGEAVGEYDGKPEKRTFIITLHTGVINPNKKPVNIMIDGVEVTEKTDSSALVNSEQGWWWNTAKNGIVYVKTKAIPSHMPVKIVSKMVSPIINPQSKEKNIFNHFSLFSKSGKMSLCFNNNVTGKIEASLYSIQGKLIIHKVINIMNRKVVQWNTNSNISGTYVLKLRYKGKGVYRKFITIN